VILLVSDVEEFTMKIYRWFSNQAKTAG